jgi:C-terminal processing protease CtpA/Prc
MGDKIVSINGIEASDLELNSINGFLNSKPGKRISIQIERNGTKIRKDFRLEDPL